jgi:Ser/Thr protein kinase RdoA (MazF antagonist)
MTGISTEAVEAASHWGGVPLRLLTNRENVVFEMVLPDRSHAALRLHRPGYQSALAIKSELWWCTALAARGLPVAAPVPTAHGETLATLRDGRLCSAVRWLPGVPLGLAGQTFDQPPPRIRSLHHALGDLIAQVHAATDAMTLPDDFVRPLWNRGGLVGDAPFWGAFWDHPAADADQRAILLAARRFLSDWLAGYPVTGPGYGPIHADVLRENVLVDGDDVSLIDFDDCGVGYRVYDLGTVLSQNLYEPDYPAIRDALMAGYGQTRAVTVEQVEVFTLARTCASVGWTMPRLQPHDPMHARHIARAVMWADVVMRRYG